MVRLTQTPLGAGPDNQALVIGRSDASLRGNGTSWVVLVSSMIESKLVGNLPRAA